MRSSKQQVVLIAHNLRSAHNVGSILRTSEGLGINKVYLTGYTPYPISDRDSRLPHLARRISAQIHKTALGAESNINWEQNEKLLDVINRLKNEGFAVVALEQTKNSIPLNKYQSPSKVALIVGREVEGIEEEVLNLVDEIIEIPMRGKKESFNVSVAAAIGLYYLCMTLSNLR